MTETERKRENRGGLRKKGRKRSRKEEGQEERREGRKEEAKGGLHTKEELRRLRKVSHTVQKPP